MLEELRKFFDEEYALMEEYFSSKHPKDDEKRAIEKAIHHCLGAGRFCLMLGNPYKEVDSLFQKYKKAFENLLDKT